MCLNRGMLALLWFFCAGFSPSAKASSVQNIQSSLALLSQSIAREIASIKDQAQAVLPDLELHTIDNQNPKPRVTAPRLQAVAISSSLDQASAFTIVAKDRSQEELYGSWLEQARSSLAFSAEGGMGWRVADQLTSSKLYVLSYLWGQKAVVLFVDTQALLPIIQAQSYQFENIWMVGHQNQILGGLNASLIGKALQGSPYLEHISAATASFGEWRGEYSGRQVLAVFQRIPNTQVNLVALVTEPPFVQKYKAQILAGIGALLVILGLLGAWWYLRPAKLPAALPRAESGSPSTEEAPRARQLSLGSLGALLQSGSVSDKSKSLQDLVGDVDAKVWSYIQQQSESRGYIKTILPWVDYLQDVNKFPKANLTLSRLAEELGNLKFLKDKVFLTEDLGGSKKIRVSYHQLRAFFQALESFFAQSAQDEVIQSINLKVTESGQEARLYVEAQLASVDLSTEALAWFDWAIGQLPLPVTFDPQAMTITFEQYTEVLGAATPETTHTRIRLGDLLEKADEIMEEIREQKPNLPKAQQGKRLAPIDASALLSEEAMQRALSAIEDAPSLGLQDIPEGKMFTESSAKVVTIDSSDLDPSQMTIEPKVSPLLEFETRIRKPGDKANVTG